MIQKSLLVSNLSSTWFSLLAFSAWAVPTKGVHIISTRLSKYPLTRQLVSNAQCSAEANCDILTASPDLVQCFGWINVDQFSSAGFEDIDTIASTRTVDTVVNTDNGVTNLATQSPDDYVQPQTNAAGAHVETVTYVQSGQEFATELSVRDQSADGVGSAVS